MAYKSFKGKWQAFGEKPIISILSTGLICFNTELLRNAPFVILNEVRHRRTE
ncbi:MAG: hypothetical protein HY762_00765 [Planctomycetes bacterium]|nr:hypothetical protein [Planctomycetota bacterium]